MLCGAASERHGDAGLVTVMLLLVMVVMVGGWAITDCIEVVLGVWLGRVSGEPSFRIRFFHRYSHAVLSRGHIANPWCGGGGSILGSVSSPRSCCGCQLTSSQSVGEWLFTFFFLSSRVCWSAGVFWPFLPRVRSLPGCIPSNSTTRPMPGEFRMADHCILRCNIENPKCRRPAAQSTRNATLASLFASSAQYIQSSLPWRTPQIFLILSEMPSYTVQILNRKEPSNDTPTASGVSFHPCLQYLLATKVAATLRAALSPNRQVPSLSP